MQVSLVSKEGLQHRVKFVVPAVRVEDAYKKKLNKAVKSAKVDGFRPGKTPIAVIEQRYGAGLRYEAIDDVLKEALFSGLEEQKLSPAGLPLVENLKAEKGQDLEFEAVFEIYPEIDPKDLTGVEIETISAEVLDADIDATLEKLRKQKADWEQVDRAAKEGDQVIIDFDGYIDNEQMKNGQAEKVPLILGSKMMIPGFEDGILGAKAGDELKIHVTFPKDYHAADIADKTAEFKIKVHEVQESKLPELNDAFAEAFGIKTGGVEALKKDLVKHMSRELTRLLKSKNKKTVFDAVLKHNDFPLPMALVEQETEALHKAAHNHDHADGEHHHCSMSDEEKSALKEEASQRVKLGLLMGELVKKHEIKLDQARVDELIKELSEGYENAEEFVRWYKSDQERLSQISMMAFEDQLLAKLLESATVKVKQLSCEELIGQRF